MLLLVDVLI